MVEVELEVVVEVELEVEVEVLVLVELDEELEDEVSKGSTNWAWAKICKLTKLDSKKCYPKEWPRQDKPTTIAACFGMYGRIVCSKLAYLRISIPSPIQFALFILVDQHSVISQIVNLVSIFVNKGKDDVRLPGSSMFG